MSPTHPAAPQASPAAAELPDGLVHCLLPMRGEVLDKAADGRLRVTLADGRVLPCDWLESHLLVGRPLGPGDPVLAMVDPCGTRGLVVGRIGPRAVPAADAELTIQAQHSLRLQCGASAVDLRADGKVMIRGEDVLVRATGTQRIRAGTVAIN